MPLLASVLAYVLFALALPVLLVHPKLRQGLRERLGLYARPWPAVPEGATRIWVHGASAGDVAALVPLAYALRERLPDAVVIATTITNSGRAMAARHVRAFSAVAYLPYDLPGSVRRAFDRIAPQAVVLEYTELWPHLIHAAAARGVPVILHNGRFSAARLHRYRWLFRCTGNLVARLRLLLVRDDDEAERARRLGAPSERIHVTGNTKLDRDLGAFAGGEAAAGALIAEPTEDVTRDPKLDPDLGAFAGGEAAARSVSGAAAGGGPADGMVTGAQVLAGAVPAGARLWVAGSTHAGEEEIVVAIHARLRRELDDLHAIVAPRYVERAGSVAELARRAGLSVRLRSEGPGGPPVDVLVLDSIGELPAAYALADVAFVGGSLVRRGGHNILEPAALGTPVVFGPHDENIADAARLLEGRGATRVGDAAELEEVLRRLLTDRATREAEGEAARAAIAEGRGAAARNADLIAALLDVGHGPGPRAGAASAHPSGR